MASQDSIPAEADASFIHFAYLDCVLKLPDCDGVGIVKV